MEQPNGTTESQGRAPDAAESDTPFVRFQLVDKSRMPRGLTPGTCDGPAGAGNPPAGPVHDRQSFEDLLAGLSATFVNLPADEVDSQIEAALMRLVKFLGTDRGGLAE